MSAVDSHRRGSAGGHGSEAAVARQHVGARDLLDEEVLERVADRD